MRLVACDALVRPLTRRIPTISTLSVTTPGLAMGFPKFAESVRTEERRMYRREARRWTANRKDGKRCTRHATERSNVTAREATCRCVAYNWPHRPGGGLCWWPRQPGVPTDRACEHAQVAEADAAKSGAGDALARTAAGTLEPARRAGRQRWRPPSLVASSLANGPPPHVENQFGQPS